MVRATHRPTLGSPRRRRSDLHPVAPWKLTAVGGGGVLVGLALAPVSGIASIVLIAFCGLPLLVGVAQIRMSRAIRRLSRGAAATPRPERVRLAGWSPPPPLRIQELGVADAPTLPIPDGVPILFLWVFDHVATGSLLHRLNQIGPVYLLRGGGILAFELTQVPRMALGRIDRMIEESEAEVTRRLEAFRPKRRFGYHSLLTMACTDAVWSFALDRMLERCRVVVVDLSDFVPERNGIVYEIGLLLDRVPLERVVFVCGPDTDREGLRRVMDAAWDTLAPTSPNRRVDLAIATLALTTELVEDNGARPGTFSANTLAERELIAALVARADASAPRSSP